MKIASVFANNEEALSSFLSSTRQEKYQALELFHNHVKYTMSLMFSLLTAVSVVFSITGASGIQIAAISQSLFRLTAGVILVLLFPLGIISILIIARYYKLYVAALVFSAEAHEAVGLADHHIWFKDLKSYKQRLEENYSVDEFIRLRTYSWPHSWMLYSILIGLISVSGLCLGIIVLWSR